MWRLGAAFLVLAGISLPQQVGPTELGEAIKLEGNARALRRASRDGQEVELLESRAFQIRARHIRQLTQDLEAAPVGQREALVDPETFEAPKLIHRTLPEYNEAAKRAKVEGVVEVRAEIWPDGRLHRVRLHRSLGFGLDEQALACIRQWQFRPPFKDGQRVPAETMITVHFRLP